MRLFGPSYYSNGILYVDSRNKSTSIFCKSPLDGGMEHAAFKCSPTIWSFSKFTIYSKRYSQRNGFFSRNPVIHRKLAKNISIKSELYINIYCMSSFNNSIFLDNDLKFWLDIWNWSPAEISSNSGPGCFGSIKYILGPKDL